jgi:hypothetical protein
MSRQPPRRNAPRAREYAIRNAERLDQWAALLMEELGLSKDRIGSSDYERGKPWRAFFAEEMDGGGNSPGRRLNLDSGVFNDALMRPFGRKAGRAWRNAATRARAMAVLAHEDEESQGYTHDEAVERAPATGLPISFEARELLKIISEDARRKQRGR